MRIGLIDVDSHNFPNLPLMKLSAWHKQQGDSVEWYDPMTAWKNPLDKVYISKVFSFTPDYQYYVHAKEVVRGGSGYCISLENGEETYCTENDSWLPYGAEHIYPDYSLYPELTKDTAYGFLTRGCPRGCRFCHVGVKEGKKTYKVADLSEFWKGQKNIILLDPNMFACRDWKDLCIQLIHSGAWIDFSQGCDIRLMTSEKIKMLMQIRIKQIHFAWDDYSDKDEIIPKFREFKELTGWDKRKLGVYVLCNYNSTLEQDLERVYTLRDLGYSPYVMIYDKEHVPRGHNLRRLQRWVNSRTAFMAVERFEDFR